MEKITYKDIENGKEFQEGLKEFKEKRVKNEGVKSKWCKIYVSKTDWEKHYSKLSYTMISKDEGGVLVGFVCVHIPEGAVEITDVNELVKVQTHRESNNHFPQPMELKNT